MQKKKMEIANLRTPGTRPSRMPLESDLEKDALHISSVEAVLGLIPADVISRRAVECKSFARALFHWEQYIRQQRQLSIDAGRSIELEPYYERLQDIYTQIDEPDGIEGISSHLHVLDIDQQILEHRKAGRWTAVQSWYELLLTKEPDDLEVQYNLLLSLKESGQHGKLGFCFEQTLESNSHQTCFSTKLTALRIRQQPWLCLYHLPLKAHGVLANLIN